MKRQLIAVPRNDSLPISFLQRQSIHTLETTAYLFPCCDNLSPLLVAELMTYQMGPFSGFITLFC